MKFSQKIAATLSVLSAVALASGFLASSASAQTVPTRGMDGSYVGAGVAAGLNEDTDIGGNIQGRVDLPVAPVSVRGAVLFSDDNSAIMPLLTYDLPVARNTNVYAGAGYSFVENDGRGTPLGNQDSVVLTTGVESSVLRNLVLYGDVKLGIDAFQNNSNAAVSLQAGAGYRF
ncbi:hypothetical protein IQ268_22430 [Oculatella sp. LEGE 06141]|uniref:outer membrane beta-barrel protein n=1 Tax=Oculatella sp. LEGE 06141 TaxID=1828648 RepID=UPI001881F586|nr:outer membrane beta-barrel protein [Oculatella sp. LEGE 06141]MBE9181322.1 hypothetical protein [Oculatella sp. LEGE 06141]